MGGSAPTAMHPADERVRWTPSCNRETNSPGEPGAPHAGRALPGRVIAWDGLKPRGRACGNMWNMLKLTCALVAVLTIAPPPIRAEEYVPGPDSQRQPGVPQAKVTKYEWTSKIYPGTVRDYWIYVPAQYKPE